MLSPYYSQLQGISIVLAFAFLFVGCSSSGSDNGNNGQQTRFDSGIIAAGATYSYTFEAEETVEYFCELHAPHMQGEITVSATADSMGRDTVLMDNEQFQPAALTVAPNTIVVWINNENVDHTVVSGNPSSNSGNGGTNY